jgi:hypothetical protein
MAHFENKVFTGGMVFAADLELLKGQGEKVAHIIRLTLRTYANNIRIEAGTPALAMGGRYRDDEPIPEEIKGFVQFKGTVADALRHSHKMPDEPETTRGFKFPTNPTVTKKIQEDEAKDAVTPEEEEKIKNALTWTDNEV